MFMKDSQRNVLVSVFSLLFCASMLVYSGRIVGVDGRAVLATAATYVQHGTWDINLISSDEWAFPPPGGQGVVGSDGMLYGKKAPLTAVLLVPFVALGKLLPFLGVIQAALLAIPLAYALTGVIFVLGAQRMGLDQRWAVIGALWWGLGTFALANTQEVFAEPFMALGFALCFYGALGLSLKDTLLSGLGAALVIGGNTACIILMPAVLLFILRQEFLKERQRFSNIVALWKPLSVRLVIWSGPILAVLCLTCAFNMLRSGSPFNSGYHFGAGEGFTTPLWIGLYGLLISPYRGIVWYAPITLLSLLGAWLARRQAGIFLCLILILGQLILFSLWWSWQGGLVWGPRFLLPVLPLIVMMSTFGLRHAWRSRPGLVILLAVTSLIIQIPGTLIHYSWYEGILANQAPSAASTFVPSLADSAIQDPLQSPLVGTWQFFSRPDTLWPVWGYPDAPLNHGLIILALLSACFGAQAIFIAQRKRAWPGLLVCILSSAAAAGYASHAITPTEVQPLTEFFRAHTQPDDRLVAIDTSFALLAEIDTRPITFTMPNDAQPFEALTERVLAMIQGDRVWWMTRSFQPTPLECVFRKAASASQPISIGDYRLVIFGRKAPTTMRDDGRTFANGVKILRYGLETSPADIRLMVEWSGRVPEGHGVFVHLLNSEGQILAQIDRPAQDQCHVMDGKEQIINDGYLLPTGPRAAAIRVGWVDAAGTLQGVDGAEFLVLPLPTP
jgi:hypothetical protein